MMLLLGLVVVIAFLGLGFLSHIFWIGVLVGLVLIVFQQMRAGLDPGRPAGRLNIRLLSSFGRYLEETTDRAVKRAPVVTDAIEADPQPVPVFERAAPAVAPAAAPTADGSQNQARQELGDAALEAAVTSLRSDLGREPDVRELAAHLNLPDEAILDAISVQDVVQAAGSTPRGGRHAAR